MRCAVVGAMTADAVMAAGGVYYSEALLGAMRN